MSSLLLFLVFYGMTVTADLVVVRKCCLMDQIYDQKTGKCVQTVDPTSNDTSWAKGVMMYVTTDTPSLIVGGPRDGICRPGYNFMEFVANTKARKTKVTLASLYLRNNNTVATVTAHPQMPVVKQLDDICIDRVNGTTDLLVRLCFQPPCDIHTCLRKCCPVNKTYEEKDGKFSKSCIIANYTWIPKLHHIYAFSAEEADQSNVHILLNRPPDCPGVTEYTHLNPSERKDDLFYLDELGRLYVPALRTSYSQNEYCVENITGSVQALICPPGSSDNLSFGKTDRELAVIASMLIVSEICLMITCAVYASVPELKNLHGKNLLSCVSALLVAFFFLIANQLGGRAILLYSKPFCRAVGLISHYGFMAAFSWMSVMSFDIWSTFRSMRAQTGRDGSSDRQRYMLYSVYAWGLPLVISIITMIMEFAPGISPFVIKPRLAATYCWFDSKERIFIYFLGPMAAVLTLNLVFIIMAIVKLMQIMKQVNVLKNLQDNKEHQKNKSMCFLYVKLLIVTGTTWIFEVVSWAIPGYSWIKYIPDVLNSLQGVFIFIIFVCKRSILRKLNKRFGLIQNKRLLGILSLETTVSPESQTSNVSNSNSVHVATSAM